MYVFFFFLRNTIGVIREHRHQQAQIFLPEVEGSIAAGCIKMEIIFGISERFRILFLLLLRPIIHTTHIFKF